MHLDICFQIFHDSVNAAAHCDLVPLESAPSKAPSVESHAGAVIVRPAPHVSTEQHRINKLNPFVAGYRAIFGDGGGFPSAGKCSQVNARNAAKGSISP